MCDGHKLQLVPGVRGAHPCCVEEAMLPQHLRPYTRFSPCSTVGNDSKQYWKQHSRLIELISEGGDCVKSAYCVEWGLHCMLMNTEVPWKWEVELSEEPSWALWFLPNSPSPTRQDFPGAQTEKSPYHRQHRLQAGLALVQFEFP